MNTGKKIRMKMYMTLVCVIAAFLVLGGATFAWLTISTDPEIEGITASIGCDTAIKVSSDNSDYGYSQKINMAAYAPLIPVSTTDGLNWFVCKYSSAGDVVQEADDGESQYMYLRFPDGGNVLKTETVPVKSELGNSSAGIVNYYIYTDIYLKTENERTDVYLSLPSSSNYETKSQKTEQNHYGTYVLSYSYDEAAGTFTTLKKEAETSVRVGFMVLGAVEDGEGKEQTPEESSEITNPEYFYVTSNYDDPDTTGIKDSNPFYIYEPNADLRSATDKTSETYNTDLYIVGFRAKTFFSDSGSSIEYKDADGYYLQTYPVALTDTSFAAIKSMLDGTAEGSEPLYSVWKMTGQDLGDGSKADGVVKTFPVSNLIIQKTSSWKISEDTVLQSETETASGETAAAATSFTKSEDMLNSTQVGVMGAFLDTSTTSVLNYVETPENIENAGYTAVDVANINIQYRSAQKLTTLIKGVPQKIRIYFWIEGQDVDCWNDISTTDFMVNLEFMGDVQEQ